jgi:hypothetical protein
MVKVPTGGKKKKLKTRVARTEESAASKNPHLLAMISSSSRYTNPTVVALTGSTLYPMNVMVATPAKHIDSRNGCRFNAITSAAIVGEWRGTESIQHVRFVAAVRINCFCRTTIDVIVGA